MGMAPFLNHKSSSIPTMAADKKENEDQTILVAPSILGSWEYLTLHNNWPLVGAICDDKLTEEERAAVCKIIIVALKRMKFAEQVKFVKDRQV